MDIAQRTVRVHGHLDQEKDPLLRPGMFVRAMVETTSRRVPVLPDKAAVEYKGKQYVFRQERVGAGQLAFRMVEARRGEQAGGYSEVFIPGAGAADTTARYATKAAYSLLGKPKNPSEE